MILYKIFQKFLLPSLFIPVLILVGLMFLRSKKRGVGKVLVITSFILYYFFSITPSVDLILRPLEGQYPKIEQDKLFVADKIVLLTGSGESNLLRSAEVLRLYVARSKLAKPSFKVIISGTDALRPEEDEEARKAKEFLVARGVLSDDIILENKSRNTFESAKEVKEIVGQEPFFLVTSAYHLPRSIKTFKKMGTSPIPAPTDFKREGDYTLFDFFPSPGNLTKADLAFHEYFGLLYYRIKFYAVPER